MKLLVVSPDYASHLLPMLQVARAWGEQYGAAVVATGPATQRLVEDAGLPAIALRLGKGSNGGVIEATEQPPGEDEHLRAFFEATRQGPIAVLRYQAEARRHDLLHEPDRVLDRLRTILDEVRPDRVLVDHVAFGARLALHALGVAPATIVLGHPSALPAPAEVYGLPPRWPRAMCPPEAERLDLARQCRASTEDLHTAADEMLRRRAPHRLPAGDLTSSPGQPTVYVYPSALHDAERPLPAHHVFVGSLVRTEPLDHDALPEGVGPRVTVALGSFLSARGDVLTAAVRAAHIGQWRLALAHGSTPIASLGAPPAGSKLARHIPQVALLRHTDVAVHHGGNGSITEAAAAGVPMVVLPFSTDQFAGAAAVERAGVGVVLSPNGLTAEVLAEAVAALLRSDANERARALALSVRGDGGASAAVEAIAREQRWQH